MNRKMTTPIHDFASAYAERGASRLHMPGHKGRGPLGVEALDITEIPGADSLYEASGIIAESERNAAALFGTAHTFYSTEGSSQCIRAMLYLALLCAEHPHRSLSRPVALAARNAHKAFVQAAALCDFDVEWIRPEGEASLCACPVTPAALEMALDTLRERPFCVYLTSPDYLGGQQDIAALAKICHARGVPLLVDNAHGAYLRFLRQSAHPIELGADMACDSAHKTLPVLTGGAYLHISARADARYAASARQALSLFGSTSPSYLILQSLDCANALLASGFTERLAECVTQVDQLKTSLREKGFDVLSSDPLKLTLHTDGARTAATLRSCGVECEFADAEHVVLMFSPNTDVQDFERVDRALRTPLSAPQGLDVGFSIPPQRMRIRDAVFAPAETIDVRAAVGRVCAAPTVACPPAIPIAVSGEVITQAVANAFLRYGIERVSVVR